MKLTYTVEVEMQRDQGPNLTRAQVAAEVAAALNEAQHIFSEGFSTDRLGELAFEARWYPVRWEVVQS